MERNEAAVQRRKAIIRQAGHSYRSLAREIGITPQGIYAIVHGKAEGATGRYALAAALGCEVKDLWPDEEEDPEAARRRGVAV